MFLIVSSVIIFSILYFKISQTLEERDWKLLKQKAQEYSDRLNINGLEDFNQYFAMDLAHDQNASLLIQIMGENGKSLFLHEAVPPFSLAADKASETELNQKDKPILHHRQQILGSPDYALVYAQKLDSGDTLFLAKNTDGLNAQMDQIRSLFAWAILSVLVLSSLGAFILGNQAMAPVRELVSAVKALQNSSLSSRVSVKIKDAELNALQQAFNHMLDQIESLVSSLTEAFDHLAHDIRTPVTRLRGRAEMALNAAVEDVEQYREALQSCYENSDRILKFIDNLTQITEAENRSINIKYQEKSLGEMVQEIMDLYEIAFEEKNIVVKQILVKNDTARLDPNLIRRVIANLLDNAHKYTPEGGEVIIETYRTEKNVVISIRDNGHGIPKDEQALIWNRLYRGDKSRSEYGMGLGLTFVKAVVEAHGGVVNVISPIHHGRGSEFLLKFKIT